MAWSQSSCALKSDILKEYDLLDLVYFCPSPKRDYQYTARKKLFPKNLICTELPTKESIMDTSEYDILAGTNDAKIICPKCQQVFRVKATRIQDFSKKYNLCCICGHAWEAIFNLRKHVRLQKVLIGSILRRGEEFFVDIVDLSIGGCAFVCRDGRCKLRLGDQITIQFRLDNSSEDWIACQAVVRNIQTNVGVEFVGMKDGVRKKNSFLFSMTKMRAILSTSIYIYAYFLKN